MGESNYKGKTLSRREALKAIVAAGGVVTLSTLPNNWENPVIQVGNLPVHAQATSASTISNLSISDSQGTCNAGGGSGDLFSASFDYQDPTNGVIAGQTQVRVDFRFSSGSTDTDEVTLEAINISGNSTTGAIVLSVCVGFGSADSVDVTIYIANASGLVSNSISGTITNPTPKDSRNDDPQKAVIKTS